MTPQAKYLLALGGFRRAVRALVDAGTGLREAAQEIDPTGDAPDDVIAAEIFGESTTDLLAMCALMPGMRQLFRAALGE